MRFACILALACLPAVAQTKSVAPKSSGAKSAAPKAAAKGASKGASKAAPDLMNPASLRERAPDVFLVRLETTKGNMTLRLDRSWAPNGVDRFYNLVRAGYYNNVYFFRCLDFMVQAGISSRPAVARVWANQNIPDDPVKQTNRRGTITMAAAASPNTRSTQIFINRTNNARLDPLGFAPLGEVIEGLEVVDAIYSGYGEEPDQFRITNEGEAYLNRYYPRLDKIVKATIVPR